MTAQTLLTASICIAVTYLSAIAIVAIVAAVRAGGRREDALAPSDAVSVSRFTIPVSVIVPVTGDTTNVSRSIAALLRLNYPAFEVIVVADGVGASSFEALAREWQLGAKEFFYRRTLHTADVRRIYRSGADARVMVIDKAPGGYGDALNCGVNVARFRYVMPLSPDIVFDADALFRLMSAALLDPASVVAASNHIERAAGPAGGGWPLFERLASLRALLNTRLAWRHLRHGVGPHGAVFVWRRDVVLKLDGFSQSAADPDLDLMFRVQAVETDRGGRVARSGDVFGQVEPGRLERVFAAAARRQRAALQTLGRVMRGRPHSLDRLAFAHFIESEIVTPALQTWVVLGALSGAVLGWFSWTAPFFALLLLSFGNAAVTAAALLLRGFASGSPDERELGRLLIAAPLDFVLYRPVLALARLAGAVGAATVVKSSSV
jgi:hypothetical protein